MVPPWEGWRSSDVLSMATNHSCPGPLLHPESTTRGLGQLPGLLMLTLLRGLRPLVAPQAPGCQVLVPLLKGLEAGRGEERSSSRLGLCCCAQLPCPLREQEAPPSAPGPHAEAQNRSDL